MVPDSKIVQVAERAAKAIRREIAERAQEGAFLGFDEAADYAWDRALDYMPRSFDPAAASEVCEMVRERVVEKMFCIEDED